MRRPGYIVLLSAILTCGLCAVSCNRENPAYNRENLKATWLVHTLDGSPLDERSCTVMTFTSSSTVTWAGVLTLEDANYQWGENTLLYDVYCCDLSVTGTFDGLFGYLAPMETAQEYSFVHHEDSLMTLGVERWMTGGEEVTPEFSQMTMRKLPASYSATDTIAGVWQFITRGGENFSSYRIQFASDGGLTLSSRSGENDWTPMGAGEDYFRIYDDFLALTLYDNPVFGTPAKWDVKCFRIDSISDSTATMSLRSAGESFTLSYISSN